MQKLGMRSHREFAVIILLVSAAIFYCAFHITQKITTKAPSHAVNAPVHPVVTPAKEKGPTVPTHQPITQSFCEREVCVVKFLSYAWTAMMNYAPQYGLANCAIPKSLSTVSMAIFCYLYNVTNFVSSKKRLANQGWQNRFCMYINEVDYPDSSRLHADNWTHIAVVRHPIDRFLSGFVDKCVK